jgi:hypothetical protein
MNDHFRQQHFKTNASLDADQFLDKLNDRIDSESADRRKTGIGLSTLAVAVLLYLFIPIETIISDENLYSAMDYLEDSNDLDELDLINIFTDNNLEFVSNNEEF